MTEKPISRKEEITDPINRASSNTVQREFMQQIMDLMESQTDDLADGANFVAALGKVYMIAHAFYTEQFCGGNMEQAGKWIERAKRDWVTPKHIINKIIFGLALKHIDYDCWSLDESELDPNMLDKWMKARIIITEIREMITKDYPDLKEELEP